MVGKTQVTLPLAMNTALTGLSECRQGHNCLALETGHEKQAANADA